MTLGGRVRNLETLETPRFSGARVYNSANISVPTGASTPLTFNSERWDTDNYHSTSVNIGFLTAPINGYYFFSANAQFAFNATGLRQLSLVLNGTTNVAVVRVAASGTAATMLAISSVYYLQAGEYMRADVRQDSGGNLNIEAAGNFSPEFMIALLG